MDIEREIKQLGDQIKHAESEISKAEGSLETLMKRLKEEENIESLEEAEKLIVKLEKSKTDLMKEIQSKLTEIKKIYGY